MQKEIDKGFRQARAMIDNCQAMDLGNEAKCGAYTFCQGCRDILGEEEFDKMVKRR